MKFKYLGTAAAERVPATFCNCETCNTVRSLGGKNIRTCSQAMIDEDLLIDLCPDTYMHTLQYGLRMDKVKYLLVTHSHGDHFSAYELIMRQRPYAHGLPAEISVLCNAVVADMVEQTHMTNIQNGVAVTVVEPFRTYTLGEYEIIPLPARHMNPEQAVVYIIKKGEKSILYGHDSGYFYDEIFEYIEKNKIKFDLVSLDCTEGFNPLDEKATHMSLNLNERVCERLRGMGAITPETLVYLNHFSHNGRPVHENLEEYAKKFGAKIAYDGLEIQL